MNTRSFLARFVHPRIAAIVTIGISLWIISFLIALTGLVLRRRASPELIVQLFFISSVIDLIGIGMVLVCVLWLVGLRMKQRIRSWSVNE